MSTSNMEVDRAYVSNVAAPVPVEPMARPRRRRKATSKLLEEMDEDLPPPKLKFKMNSSGVGGSGNPDSGPRDGRGVGWDRELDSDPEEPLAVEEQFVLRLPTDVAPHLREMVQNRNVTSDVWFKFKDSRRAVFHLGNKLYGAKLVDLPALVESQRMTGIGGHCVKVCDVSQMLLVEEDELQDEADVTRDKAFNIDDFVYPHGLTPPLKHVRKRRFRKRINKRTIETVEHAVEQLLEQDAKADEVQYEFLDHDPTSDDEYGSDTRGTVNGIDADSLGAPTPLGQMDGDDEAKDGDDDADVDRDEEDEEDEEDEDEAFDSDLANEINKGLEALNASASEDEDASDGSEDGGLFGGSSDDDDDDDEEDDDDDEAGGSPEALEQKRRIKLLAEETVDLEKAIAAKEADMQKAANPIFKKRFEEIIRKLTAERDLKKAQHATAIREMEKKKAGEEQTAAASAEISSASAAASTSIPSAQTIPNATAADQKQLSAEPRRVDHAKSPPPQDSEPDSPPPRSPTAPPDIEMIDSIQINES